MIEHVAFFFQLLLTTHLFSPQLCAGDKAVVLDCCLFLASCTLFRVNRLVH
jgi:hypothetical protein